MGETEPAGISDVSEPTKEQTEEEENEEEVILEEGDSGETDPKEDEVTDEKPADQQEEQPSGTETTETLTGEPEVEEETVAAVGASETDSLEEESTAAESVILTKSVKTTQGENNTTTTELVDLEHAEIIYTNSCASADGTQVRKGTDVTFRILADTGYQVKANGVKFASKGKDGDKSAVDALNELTASQVTGSVQSSGSGVDTVYTVPQSNFADGKSVLIAVELEEIQFTIDQDGAAVTIEMVKDGKPAAKEAVKYSAAGSVELAISGISDSDDYVVTAKAGNNRESDPITGTHVPAVADDPNTADVNEAVKEYWSYPLNILNLDGAAKYENQKITVTVTAKDVVTVGTKAAETTRYWTGTITAPSINAGSTDEEQAENATYTPYINTSGQSYGLGKKVAFVVNNPADETVWKKVSVEGITAKLVKPNCPDIDNLEVKAVPDGVVAGLTAVQAAYYVQLPTKDELTEKDYTLEIHVAAERAEGLKKIKVDAAADAQAVLTVTGGEVNTDTHKVTFGSEIETEKGSYFLNIDSKEGYQLDKVEVAVTVGHYDADHDGAAFPTDYKYDLLEDEDGPVYTLTQKEIKLTGTDTPNKEKEDGTPDKDGWAWTADEVTVTISVKEIEGADEEKTVTISSASNASKLHYNFTVADGEVEGGKVTITGDGKKDEDQTYTIAEGTKVLSFTVDAKREPTVSIDSTPISSKAPGDFTISQSGDQWTYQIPAKALAKVSTIAISREAKTVTINNPTTGSVKYSYLSTTDKYQDLTSGSVDADEELLVKVSKAADKRTPIGTVTYKVGGADAAATSATPDVDGNYEFTVTASDNITITVTSVADARLFVENTRIADKDQEKHNGDKVEVDYEDATTAYLRKSDDATNVKLLNATVTHDGKLAQTKAEIKTDAEKGGDIAVIEKVAKSEQEKELEVTLLTEDRTTVSFTLVSDKAVDDDSEITYTDDEGNKLTSIELNADTTQTIHVNAASGTISKLAYEIVNTPAEGADAPADAKTPKKDAQFKVNLARNGDLTIIANPVKAAVSNAGTIVLYEENDTTDKKVIKGSALNVTIGDPVMKGRASSISIDPAKVTLRKIPVEITMEDEVKGENVNGSIGYQFKVNYTAPAGKMPADFTGTPGEWALFTGSVTANIETYKKPADGKFFEVNELYEGHEIRISADSVKAYPLSDVTVQARAVQFDNTGALIANGEWSEAKPVTIPKPYYSDTLKLGKGESTLTTGQDRNVVVAVPEFNEKGENARYKDVVVELIDKSTGLDHKNADDFNGNYGYNAVTGEVWINARDLVRSDNLKTEYANLAVKVTAFTESGDYGVSGVKPLKVENGLQYLSVSVQDQILKADAKSKVTVKPVVTYNSTNKKLEPASKYKKVTYSIVGAGSNIIHGLYNSYGDFDYHEDGAIAPLSKAMQEAVDSGKVSIDAKGTITLAKDFQPEAGKDYSFKVLVKADDPLNNREVQNVSNKITIIGQAMELGTVGIFERQSNNRGDAKYDKGKLITSGVDKGTVDLPVTSMSGQYVLGMIRPGITRTGDIYDLTSDMINTNLLLLSSSNAKNVKVYADGSIEVNKLGKVSFTVKVESNSKKQSVAVKNINFKMEDTPLYAKVTKYQGVAFNEEVTHKYYPVAAGQVKFETAGNETGYYKVELMKKTGDGDEDYTTYTLPNYSYSYKKAKDVTSVYYNGYPNSIANWKRDGKAYVMATGSGTGKNAPSIIITNKQAKPAAKLEIVIENTNVTANAAPKLAMADKKQKIYADDNWHDVTLTVTTAGKNVPEFPDDAYIMLTADWTKKLKTNYGYSGVFCDEYYDEELNKVIPVEKTGKTTGKFTISMRSNVAESYTLLASLGKMDEGEFTQTYKEARVTLKTTKVNAAIKVTPVSFTLNPYGVSRREMKITSGYEDFWCEHKIETEIGKNGNMPVSIDNYAQNLIQADGVPNAFNTYFIITNQEIKTDAKGNKYTEYKDDRRNYHIMINPSLTDTQLADLANPDFMKANGTGYVTVANAGKRIDQKITVKVEGQDKLRLTASADPVLTGPAGTVTDIYVKNGKEAVALADYSVESADFEQYYSDAIKDTVVEEYKDGDKTVKITEKQMEDARLAKGIIRVKTKAADLAIGKKDVTIKVMPADSVDSVRATVNNNTGLARNGKQLGVKIDVQKSDAVQKLVIDKANKTWIVSSQDWVDEGTGWWTEIEYNFKNRLNVANHQKIKFTTDKNSYVFFGQDIKDAGSNLELYNANGTQKVGVYLDKEELKKAMAADKKLTWNKQVTVKASLTFPGEGADAKDLPIKTEMLSITIKLPTAESFPDAASLSAEIEAKNAVLQKFAESRTQYHIRNKDRSEGLEVVAERVSEDLKAKVLEISNGSSAKISTAGWKYDTAKKMFVYPLSVDNTSWTFHVYYGDGMNYSNAQSILEKAESYTADKLDLKFYPAFTTSEELTGKLVSLMKADKVLPNNVVLTAEVSTDKTKTKAPEVGVAGKLTATIKVVNKNCTPGQWGYSADNEDAPSVYTLAALTDLSSYTTVGGTNGLKTKLEAFDKTTGAYAGKTMITSIFGGVYTKDGIKDDEVTDKMSDDLQAAIEKFAKDLAAESKNAYLEVEGVKELVCEHVADADSVAADEQEGWKLTFKVAYNNHTPETGTKTEPEVTVYVVKADVASMSQDATAVQNAAETLFGDKVIHAADENAAITAIKAMVTEACVDVEYDKTKLDVKRDEEGGQQFTAPTDDMNGMIEVTVYYEGTDKAGVPYTFVLVKNLNDEGELVKPDARKKAVDLIKATMTEDKINELVKSAWNEFWEDASTDADAIFDNANEKLVAAIKSAAEKALTDGGVANTSITVTSAAVAKVSDDVTITIPDGESGSGKIGAITITLNDAVNGNTNWEDADGNALNVVKIEAKNLKGDKCFQTEAAFKNAVEECLTVTGLAFDATWFSDAEYKVLTDDAKKKDVEGSIPKAIESAVGEAVKDEVIAPNPKWRKVYASGVTAVPDDDNSVYTANSVTKVKLKFKVDDTGRDITVKIRGLNDMDWIKSVTIDGSKIGTVKDGAVEIADNITEIDLTQTGIVTVKNPKDETVTKDITWSLDSSHDGIDIENNKKLVIDKNAVAAVGDTDGIAALKLIATVPNSTAVTTGSNKDEVTLKIDLNEKVTGVDVKVDDEALPASPVYVAPAESAGDPTEITFTVTGTGTHVTDTTAEAVTVKASIDPAQDGTNPLISFNEAAKKLTLMPGADNAKVTLTFKNGANEIPNTSKIINVKGNAAAVTAAKLSMDNVDNEATFTPAATEAKATLVVNNQTAKDVYVPIKLPDNAVPAGAIWSCNVAQDITDGYHTAIAGLIGNDGVKFADEKPTGKGSKTESGHWLLISNKLAEVIEKTPEAVTGNDKVLPTVLTLTATVEGAGANIETKLSFELVVNKKVTGIKFEAGTAADSTVAVTDNKYTMSVATGTTLVLKAVVEGAHVSAAEDQHVKWSVVSKKKGTTATLSNKKDSATTTLTVGAEDAGNIIKIKAVSQADESEKPAEETITIVVTQ